MYGFGMGVHTPPFTLQPTLQLQFAGATALDPRITFTRASSGTHFNSTGLLVTVGNDVARFDYDPATLLPRGLLIEESRTNVLPHSRDMTQAVWTKANTGAVRTQVGIDGVASSACLMTDTTTGSALIQSGMPITAGATVTASVVLKYSNNTWVRFVIGNSAFTNFAQSFFNVQTGALGNLTATGTTSGQTQSVVSLGGGWYRYTISCVIDASSTVSAVALATAVAN